MVFVGINREETAYTISVFVAQTGWTHPVLMDQTASVYQLYQLDGNISPFPLDYIIDRDGVIRYGLTDYDPAQMQITIDLLLAQCDSVHDVTAYRIGDHLQLRWPGMASGEYQVFSSTSPDLWVLETTLPDSPDVMEVWTDPAALQVKKLFRVIHMCP